MPKQLSPLLIESGPPRRSGADLVRRHAEGLAREIQNDVMAREGEIADAIEAAIRRFAARKWQVQR
jgi:hypothetical protein